MRPYFLMALLFLSLALLMAVDSALTGLQILPAIPGLRWLRVHFITLGALTQTIFGLLPVLVAARARQPQPPVQWNIWISLNAGLLILLIGIPLYNALLIITGGTLIFIASVLLIIQLSGLRPQRERSDRTVSTGRKFYLAGLGYLLLGIIVGSGLWFGWGEALQMKVPIEVHIHANSWGFMSLVFAGLLVDLYPGFAHRALAWPRSIPVIFWMLVLGALGLVLGPWLQLNWLTAPGFILLLAATIWLLANVIRPLFGNRQAWTPGMLHLVTSYIWVLVPFLVAPLIRLKVPGLSVADFEPSAPQVLIYSWMLQFGFALLPYLFRRVFQPDKSAKLGGNWLSLLAIHTGTALLLASIFVGAELKSILHGAAYGFWALAMAPVLVELSHTLRDGLAQLEQRDILPAAGENVTTAESGKPIQGKTTW